MPLPSFPNDGAVGDHSASNRETDIGAMGRPQTLTSACARDRFFAVLSRVGLCNHRHHSDVQNGSTTAQGPRAALYSPVSPARP